MSHLATIFLQQGKCFLTNEIACGAVANHLEMLFMKRAIDFLGVADEIRKGSK